MPILWDSREWRNGTTHKLTFVAEDAAGNKASMTPHRQEGEAAPEGPTVASVGVTPVDATTVRVTGGVSTTKAQAARVSGKAFVVFQKLRGHEVEAGPQGQARRAAAASTSRSRWRPATGA